MPSALVATALVALLGGLPALAVVECVPSCTIDATLYGYRPPATAIVSGAAVQWRATDTGHIQIEWQSREPCVAQFSAPGDPGPVVRFTKVGDALFAEQEGETRACESATPLGEHALVLPYFCGLHASMRGAIVVADR